MWLCAISVCHFVRHCVKLACVCSHYRQPPFGNHSYQCRLKSSSPFLRLSSEYMRRQSRSLARSRHFLQSLVTSHFSAVRSDLFMVFHVLHSCATTSPNPWPGLESTGVDVDRLPTLSFSPCWSFDPAFSQNHVVTWGWSIKATKTERDAHLICERRPDRKQMRRTFSFSVDGTGAILMM